MKNLKIKVPNTILHDKQLKLYDFIEDVTVRSSVDITFHIF